ncbi:MAG: type II toxin-antitoxin system HicB family antitoxin [Planctomycetia bacterium]|nr:type II toxin-antitoxin system HicB family antitoxin [Planctomycetia bacterium]
MKKYAILLEPTSTGYSASVPDLPGCISAAETREETIDLFREAIPMHLEGMLSRGEPVPAMPSILEYVEVDEAALQGASNK